MLPANIGLVLLYNLRHFASGEGGTSIEPLSPYYLFFIIIIKIEF